MTDKNGENDNILRPNIPETSNPETRIIIRLNVTDLNRLKAQHARLKDADAAKAINQEIAKMIAAVANRVLRQVEPAGAKLIRRYNTLPLLAMQVTPRAMAILKSLPEVLSIEVDKQHAPMR